MESSDPQVTSILTRLSNLERRLEMSSVPGPSSDLAALRSLAPAMQGGLRSSSSSIQALISPPGPTPIYAEKDEDDTPGHIMAALSLRRDLSRPENPPFGAWWTYTVEETLAWPVLGYRGNVNGCLDALMADLDERDDDDGYDTASCRPRSNIWPDSVVGVGLDDGIVVPELIENFLVNVHAQNPILNPVQLRAQAGDLVENGLGWDGRTCRVLLACALGAISCPWNSSTLHEYSTRLPSPDRYALAQAYLHAAQKRLGILSTQPTLIAAQCLFLAGTFQMYAQKPLAGWRLLNAASIACRAYISKRVARAAVTGRRDEHLDSAEHSLFWSCFKAEREVACEFGMETAGLNTIAYSTSLPTPPNGYARDLAHTTTTHPIDLARQENSLPSYPVPHVIQEDQSWYFFLTDIMLRKLEMRIDIFMQGKRREAYRSSSSSSGNPESDLIPFFASLVSAMQEFNYQLTCYYDSLPASMRFSLDDLTPCTDELRQYLRWRLYSARHDICLPALYVLLHRDDVSAWPRSLVEDLFALANSCLVLDGIFIATAVTAHRHQNSWLSLRKAVRSALILIAARKAQRKRHVALRALRVPSKEVCREAERGLRAGLEYWAAELPDCVTSLEILQRLDPGFGGP
ncbi:hypothetical protein BJX62DRAFT_232120 [Aspergillus germanicus]